MPTLDEIFDEIKHINGNLGQVIAGQNQVRTAIEDGTKATNAVHDAVNNSNVRLDTLINGQTYTNNALHHLTNQLNTVICILEHISRNTCGITT